MSQKNMHRRVLAAFALLLAVAAAAAGGLAWAASAAEPEASVPSAEAAVAPSWLSDVASGVAADNGDARPASAKWMLASLADAAPLFGSEGEIPAKLADRQDYIVVLTGQFVAENAFYPPGREAPKGWCIVCAVNPETRAVEGFCLWPEGLSPESTKLDSLAALPLL